MPGIAPKLPLQFSEIDGAYVSMKKLSETVKQNFKMLVLTSPGERIMMPDYGVGIRQYVFRNFSGDFSRSEISDRIIDQASRYMPFVRISKIDFSGDPDQNQLFIAIRYSILSLNKNDVLELDL